MKRALCVCGVLVLCGCGTNLGGGVTLADARATCLAWDTSPTASANFDTLVLLAEVGRDQGSTEGTFLGFLLPACEGEADFSGCLACFTQMAAAVWP